MPKQIVADVLETLGDTGKQVGKGVGQAVADVVKGIPEQAGVVPAVGQTNPQITGKSDIPQLKAQDEVKKAKLLAQTRSNLQQYLESPPAPPEISVQKKMELEERQKMEQIEQVQKKELPPPVAAVKRRGKLEYKPGSGIGG